MKLDDNARIEEHEDTTVREVAGEAVLLHLVSERYYVLDASSTRMWQVLVSSPTLGDAVKALGSEFDVELDVLRNDLLRFTGELAAQGLVSVHDPA
jgi:hypothetical protein